MSAGSPPAPGVAGPHGRRTVVVYMHHDCHLCDQALRALAPIAEEHGATVELRDIRRDDDLLRAYFERVPVIELDGEELCEFVLDESLVRARLAAP